MYIHIPLISLHKYRSVHEQTCIIQDHLCLAPTGADERASETATRSRSRPAKQITPSPTSLRCPLFKGLYALGHKSPVSLPAFSMAPALAKLIGAQQRCCCLGGRFRCTPLRALLCGSPS